MAGRWFFLAFSQEQRTSYSSLDRYVHNSPFVPEENRRKFKSTWSKKQKRCYHRILSGLKRADFKGDHVRFITLTSSDVSSYALLNRHFETLKKRIRRKFGRFEYVKVRTNEGYGVLHILYRGSFISQKWLSYAWADIHFASIVWISKVRGSVKRIARYVVGQYVAGQSFLRMSCSWGWVCRGFSRRWILWVKAWGFKEALERWDKWLRSKWEGV